MKEFVLQEKPLKIIFGIFIATTLLMLFVSPEGYPKLRSVLAYLQAFTIALLAAPKMNIWKVKDEYPILGKNEENTVNLQNKNS